MIIIIKPVTVSYISNSQGILCIVCLSLVATAYDPCTLLLGEPTGHGPMKSKIQMEKEREHERVSG
jgi:hypothetical protein